MDLSLTHTALLFFVAIWAGALNTIAGGGTFFTFPVLMLVGMPPIIANTTNKFAITFASLSATFGFLKEIRALKQKVVFFVTTAVIGSITGSLLLLVTPDEKFERLVPWLMLCATLLFAFGGRIVRYVAKRKAAKLAEINAAGGSASPERVSLRSAGARSIGTTQKLSLLLIAIGIGQFMIGVYGGFFAAGMGILMMALYELSGMRDIHEMNALKVIVGLGINLISAITFMFVGAIDWHVAIILVAGALIGGYGGAWVSKKLPQSFIRNFIVLYGVAMTSYFFLK